MPEATRDFFTRYVAAIGARDFATLETMIHPDYVGDYPQSGERFRGFAAFRQQLEQYPGGLPAAPRTICGRRFLATRNAGR